MAKLLTIVKRVLQLAFLGICLLIGVILLRTLLLQKLPPESDICSPSEDDFIALDDAMIKRFQAALHLRTVSRAVHDYDREQLQLLDDHIINSECYWFLMIMEMAWFVLLTLHFRIGYSPTVLSVLEVCMTFWYYNQLLFDQHVSL